MTEDELDVFGEKRTSDFSKQSYGDLYGESEMSVICKTSRGQSRLSARTNRVS